ncbi:MAG: OmpA family protein [Alphaproteobacteria bacterium]|jgi:outer membrane protein OmpA-like peptidoglycan-associated protein|nr:OmpA family protein [Alphaproteobacteria bacterium]MBT4084475.1 OmpA family protein [Alphaproteobacteria bacterium]MBT4545718.1 OmpA family protein [Alphaproteobacteria bacterium]MBT7744321.1 OmpA family protein [Alphaproteobacteria bacterium]
MPDAMNKMPDHKPFCCLPVGKKRLAVATGSLFVLAVSFTSASAIAQSTVVIGGSGKSSVEVNLDILTPSSGNTTAYGRVLKMPGMKGMNDNITLRMPGSMKSAGNNSSRSAMPKLTLKRPTGSGLSIPDRKPALPMARVTTAPAPKVARVTPPPQKAVPMVKPAAPMVPKAITRPAPKPVPKPVKMAKRAPAVTPPPPPPPAPVKMASPKVAPVAPAPRVVQPMPAPVVPKAPIAAPKPARVEQKVASLPRKVNISTPGLAMRVGFSGNSTRISADEKVRLNNLAAKLADGDDRLQLKSFAGGSGETPSASRRRSLSRALAVRSYLIEKGLRSTRIDVRALGMAADQGPSDRVDVIILVR